jgi:hypothetical protein
MTRETNLIYLPPWEDHTKAYIIQTQSEIIEITDEEIADMGRQTIHNWRQGRMMIKNHRNEIKLLSVVFMSQYNTLH